VSGRFSAMSWIPSVESGFLRRTVRRGGILLGKRLHHELRDIEDLALLRVFRRARAQHQHAERARGGDLVGAGVESLADAYVADPRRAAFTRPVGAAAGAA